MLARPNAAGIAGSIYGEKPSIHGSKTAKIAGPPPLGSCVDELLELRTERGLLRLHDHVRVQLLPLGNQTLFDLERRRFVAAEHRERERPRREARRSGIRRHAA